jgi:hypothetical protein
MRLCPGSAGRLSHPEVGAPIDKTAANILSTNDGSGRDILTRAVRQRLCLPARSPA